MLRSNETDMKRKKINRKESTGRSSGSAKSLSLDRFSSDLVIRGDAAAKPLVDNNPEMTHEIVRDGGKISLIRRRFSLI